MFFIPDWTYIVLVVPAILLSLWAQANVSSTFRRYSGERAVKGWTAAQVSRMILDSYGLEDVPVQHVSGRLTDHYDPTANVIRLSDSVYSSSSIAAIGVAAHETGHAIQYAAGYFPIRIRSAVIPLTQFGSRLSIPLLLVGLILSSQSLVNVGILLFSFVTLFQLVTLPVEFNASSRAVQVLESRGILLPEENEKAKKVLRAAALTYVAALITSAAQLLRLVLLFGNRRRD